MNDEHDDPTEKPVGPMAISSISFWQQDQNYWSQAKAENQSLAQSTAVITAMSSAMTAQAKGLASIANQTALRRVNSQLTAAVENILKGSGSSTAPSSTSGSSGSSSSSSSSSSSAAVSASPAIGTGKVPVTAGTGLFTLGVLKGGTISVSDGTGTTTYTSTGTDTVGDLLDAINANRYGHASAAAWLNSSGQLVISGKNTTALITIGGTYAANVGFGTGNNSFSPTAASPAKTASAAGSSSSSSASGSSSASTGSSASASSSSTKSSSAVFHNSALALQTGSSAETLLSSDGLSGSLVNLLA